MASVTEAEIALIESASKLRTCAVCGSRVNPIKDISSVFSDRSTHGGLVCLACEGDLLQSALGNPVKDEEEIRGARVKASSVLSQRSMKLRNDYARLDERITKALESVKSERDQIAEGTFLSKRARARIRMLDSLIEMALRS